LIHALCFDWVRFDSRAHFAEVGAEPQEAGGIGESSGGEEPGGDSEYVFEKALHCPGLMHMFHNAWKDLTDDLEFFEEWFLLFSCVHALLCSNPNRRLFISRCMSQGPAAAFAALFETFTGSLAEWRWLTLITELTKVFALEEALKAAWDAAKFRGGAIPSEDEPKAEDEEEDVPYLALISLTRTICKRSLCISTHNMYI